MHYFFLLFWVFIQSELNQFSIVFTKDKYSFLLYGILIISQSVFLDLHYFSYCC